VIVDPAEFSDDMRRVVDDDGISLVGILITHGHYDHDGAVGRVRQEHNVPVYAAGSYPGGKRVGDGDRIAVGRSWINVAATPGHTEDSLTFIGEGFAFVGDALFAAAVGGTSSRAAFEREVAGVRRQILTLPKDTILYTGHGPATTVAVECCYNPFFI
jgi:glyoxylase-like metal-dependent hydrolase (beta-lactamase superfamily II)